jgi:drug/metabolite transporter (DMT)-like permease
MGATALPPLSLGAVPDALRDHFRHHHLSTHVAVAAGLALLSALAFAIAIVAQQRAAERVPDEHARTRLFAHLIRSPQWLAGTAGNGAGYVLQAVALAYGSVLIVQPLLVTSLLFALPLGARLAHRRLPPAVWVWGVVLAVSLAVFVLAGNANNGANFGSHRNWLITAAIGTPIVLICWASAHRTSGATRASLLAVAVGVLAGVLAVLTKSVVTLIKHGITPALTSWELYALLAVGAAGVYLQQLSFQAGALQASLPVIMVLEPLVAAVLGLTMLHEQLRASGLRLVVLLIAVAAMALATVALARGRAYLEHHDEPTTS